MTLLGAEGLYWSEVGLTLHWPIPLSITQTLQGLVSPLGLSGPRGSNIAERGVGSNALIKR